MAGRKVQFKSEVENKLHSFLKYYSSYVQKNVKGSENARIINHTRKLANYLHNVILRRTGMESNVYRYGSRMIGNSTPKSNLNIFVEVENRRNLSDKEHAIKVLRKIEGALSYCRIWEVIILIEDTLVPFLRVIFLPTVLTLDIVASDNFGVPDSKIMKHLLDLQPYRETKKFFFFINRWMREIHEVHIKKMVLFYLIVFYMQTKNLLPALKDVHRGMKKIFKDAREIQFDPARTYYFYKLFRVESFEDHVKGFFEFYADFNFADNIVTTYSGKSIPRCKFPSFKDLNSHMCMTAPLDIDRNVSTIGKATLEKFQRICRKSVDFMEKFDVF